MVNFELVIAKDEGYIIWFQAVYESKMWERVVGSWPWNLIMGKFSVLHDCLQNSTVQQFYTQGQAKTYATSFF